MPTRRWMGVWFLVSCLGPPLATAQERTEQEILDLVVRDGPQAAAVRATVEVTRREQAARTLFPNPSVSYTREGAGFTEFLQGEQLLPIYGTRGALARAGVAAVEAAEAERDARLWMLRANVRQAVAHLLAGQQRLADTEATVAGIERLVELLRTREQEGEGSRFDRVRAEQERADARQLVLIAAVAVATARGELTALLPRDVGLTRVSGTLAAGEVPPLDTLLQRAAAGRAELRALQRAASRFSHEADAARRAQRPTPTVMGGFKRAEDIEGRQAGGVFGVSVSLPLFNNGSRDAARWDAERQRAEQERAGMAATIGGEVTRAARIVSIHEQALSDPAFSSSAGDELVQIADTAYREGELGILELLDAHRTAARARTRVIDLTLSSRLAQIALERAVGERLWP